MQAIIKDEGQQLVDHFLSFDGSAFRSGIDSTTDLSGSPVVNRNARLIGILNSYRTELGSRRYYVIPMHVAMNLFRNDQ